MQLTDFKLFCHDNDFPYNCIRNSETEMQMFKVKNEGKSILLVDASEELRYAFQSFLELRGYNVQLASDGHKAIEAYRKGDFDLVVMDLDMPGVSGADALKTIHQNDPNLKAIVLSGYLIMIRKEQFKRFGVKEFLSKPVNMDVFLEKVQRVLEE